MNAMIHGTTDGGVTRVPALCDSDGALFTRDRRSVAVLATLLTKDNIGSNGALADQDATELAMSTVTHDGVIRFETKTVNGQGATPTSPGSGKKFKFFYGFSNTQLTATDAPTVLATLEASLDCTLPNTAEGVLTAAVGTLTAAGNPANTETVTIGSKVYTFQDVLTNVDGNVLIGATASDTLDNLIAAINLAAGGGTTYAAAMTLHPTVSATAGALDTMTATAKTAGAAGNAIATTSTAGNLTWGTATLAGGSDVATGTRYHQSANITVSGAYLYYWWDTEAFAANALIDATVTMLRI